MLSLLSAIYGKAMDVRNSLYDRGVFVTHDLGARVISIGNITTGGTGKTPLVSFAAEILAGRGETVCILTRGYGRKNSKDRVLVSDGSTILSTPADSGDEPFELAQKLLGKTIVIVDADRVSAAEWAKRKFGVTTFVLDDGFQHRRAKRDVDIVCIDATKPGGQTQAGSLRSGRVLPAGRLREPLHHLKRANVVVITRADLVDDISDLRSEISDLNSEAEIFTAKNKIVNLEEEIGEKRVFAFCGLGNPEGFYEQLSRNGIDVAGTRAFADHHRYSQKDIKRIESDAQACGAEILVSTAKDNVKLSNLKFEMQREVVRIEIEIDEAPAFAALL